MFPWTLKTNLGEMGQDFLVWKNRKVFWLKTSLFLFHFLGGSHRLWIAESFLLLGDPSTKFLSVPFIFRTKAPAEFVISQGNTLILQMGSPRPTERKYPVQDLTVDWLLGLSTLMLVILLFPILKGSLLMVRVFQCGGEFQL
jgi:hypothetical protein